MTRFFTAFVALALVLGASSANAQPRPAPSANEVAAARAQLDSGLAAAQAGRWDEALQEFSRAYELAPHPLVLLNVASAQVHTGQLVAGTESYRRFLRDVTSGSEAAQRATAEAALAALLPQIAHVRVSVTGLATGDVVTLDGHTLPSGALGVDLPLDPGPHVIAATRNEVTASRSNFALRRGESSTVTLVVRVPAREHATTPRPYTLPPRPSVWASPWLWTAVGIVLIGGAAAGGYALYESRYYSGTFSPGSLTASP